MPLATIPTTYPVGYKANAGVVSTSDLNTGGYDFTIGGHGFRLASDQTNPYQRYSEPTTVHRFDNSLEPGEQTLSDLPWIKSQSSFHAGAGQLNLEQGFNSFQYQQEQVEHIRFDNSLGVDVWTPGVVSRLPDTKSTDLDVSGFTQIVVAGDDSVSYAIVGGEGVLSQVKWTDPDDAPTVTAITPTSATFGDSDNWTIASLTTDGVNYYGVIQLAADGSVADLRTYIIKGDVSSTSSPTALYKVPDAAGAGVQVPGIVGWAKARLMAGMGNVLYELDANASAASALPTATYTHPTTSASFSQISDSPTGILAAVTSGMESSILQSTLDSSGGLPVLTGGSTIARFPPGERVLAIRNYLGTYLAIGTTAGIRIGTFDTQTGALVYGPLSVETTSPVSALCGRDRFCYGGYTDQQDDGSTGLVRVDLTFPVDQSGRLAYAPDLRPAGTTLTDTDILWVDILPTGSRLVYFTDGYAHVEGDGPGTTGDSYLTTSRIRFDTAEPKLWTRGRVHGDLSQGDIKVTGLTPFGDDKNLGTFGHVDTSDDSKIEYGLPSGLHEWIQLRFSLIGAAGALGSYQAKAIPSPARQDIIQLSANCFMNETDRDGVDVTDPELPRQRWQNIVDLETAGNAVRFVEFTNSGSVAAMVYIDQIQFSSINRPSVDSDFGGTVSLKLRIL